MKLSNLFKQILENAKATGYFTIDELVIIHSDPDYWKWLEKELVSYEHLCPAILNIGDIEQIKPV
jgi:hypothetical protein